VLIDFGKETFGKVVVPGVKGKGTLKLFYGETRQEALAETQAKTTISFRLTGSSAVLYHRNKSISIHLCGGRPWRQFW
jgi:hypothetical protein